MINLVLVSGGKDSTATLFWCIENIGIDDIIPVFCDTGCEHNLTYQYLNELEDFIGKSIIRIKNNEITFLELIKNEIPNDRIRGCNSRFKVKPLREFIRLFNSDVILYQGIRKQESKNRLKKYEGYNPNDLYLNNKYSIKSQKVYDRFPIIDWNDCQVFEYIKKNGFYPNPLYKKGFNRVGCFPCIATSKRELSLVYADDLGRQRILQIVDALNNSRFTKDEILKYSSNYKKFYDIVETTLPLFEVMNEV